MKRAIALVVTAAFVTAVPVAQARPSALPKVSDYHALLISPVNPQVILLGTHNGVYRTDDGGKTWRASGLQGQDAMNLVRVGKTVFLAGHNIFGASTDGGKSWRTWPPKGLPSLDVHGLAADPRNGDLYAQIAGTGLYRSSDGGQTFKLFSKQLNGGMMPLTITRTGSFVVGDMSRGIFVSKNGRRWLNTARGMVMGVAANPVNSKILAVGGGIIISTNGANWKLANRSRVMFGAVAWSPSRANEAYAAAADGSLWHSVTGGAHWSRVP